MRTGFATIFCGKCHKRIPVIWSGRKYKMLCPWRNQVQTVNSIPRALELSMRSVSENKGEYMMSSFISCADSIIDRRNKIRSILMKSNAVSTTQFVRKIEDCPSHQKAYYIPTPDSQVNIDYNILASDLIKSGYGNLQDFSKKVIEMLKCFCDDDDQISLKVRELDANMRSILCEFAPTFPEGVPVCKELRGLDTNICEGGTVIDNSKELIRFISERCPVYLSEMYDDEHVAFTAIRTYAINDVRKAIEEFLTGGNNESSTTVK